jgi:hypothetical protein
MKIKNKNRTLIKNGVGALGAVLLLGGCVGAPPYEDLTRGSYAIKDAENTGARDFAPLELWYANKSLDKAKAALADERYDDARYYANLAELEAEHAKAKTESLKSQKAAEELKESVRLLKEEIQRYQVEQK